MTSQEVYIELFDQIDENLKAALQRDLTGVNSYLKSTGLILILRNGSWTESAGCEGDKAKDSRSN